MDLTLPAYELLCWRRTWKRTIALELEVWLAWWLLEEACPSFRRAALLCKLALGLVSFTTLSLVIRGAVFREEGDFDLLILVANFGRVARISELRLFYGCFMAPIDFQFDAF